MRFDDVPGHSRINLIQPATDPHKVVLNLRGAPAVHDTTPIQMPLARLSDTRLLLAVDICCLTQSIYQVGDADLSVMMPLMKSMKTRRIHWISVMKVYYAVNSTRQEY
ncbi:hypothetical protein OE88DRAFT_1668632 [Heliocybe sulcata]|uniref:Uncharacterized protein n=1 Tax=Heliocybe sulcata TaxID=5364 RepID=A0A5C3MKF4_9AGAM|nr:hypothetical protein OE88DRAFT_1668632 [Heliocybe sulcata]